MIYIAKGGARNPPALPDDAVTRTFGIFGVKGSGKTTTGRVIAEGICKVGGHVVILDPVGVWWGITRDGDGKGVPGIVIGGEHGDVPLEETGGQLVAELVVGRHWPAVVIDLKLLRKGQAQRFMADFLEGVYHANRYPLHLMFEEADRALPQSARSMDPTLGRVIGAAEDIVKLGRSRGLGSTFLSQRMATVTKNVTEQVEALILHASPGARDRKAVKDWIEGTGDPAVTKRVVDSMASLDVGEAWLYSPAWLKVLDRIRVKQPKTLDSSSTPTDDERDREEQAPRAKVNIDELRDRMAETVQRAEENDPRKLHARIAELEEQVAAAPAEAPEPERILVPDRESIERLSSLMAEGEALVEEMETVRARVEENEAELAEVGRRLAALDVQFAGAVSDARQLYDAAAALPAEGRPQAPARPQARASSNGTAAPALPEGAEELSKGARGLLSDLRGLYPIQLTRSQLATILRRGARSSTLTQQLSELRAAGLLDVDAGGRHRLIGAAEPDDFAVLSRDELIDRWESALPDGPRALLTVLLGEEADIEQDELFERAGFSPTSSTPVTHLKLLRDNELAERRAGLVTLGPVLRR